jgi:hypothetical protein
MSQDKKEEKQPPNQKSQVCMYLGIGLVVLAFIIILFIMFAKKDTKMSGGRPKTAWRSRGGCGCMAGLNV